MSAIKQKNLFAFFSALVILAVLLIAKPALAAPDPKQAPPIRQAGDDALQFLGETAKRGGLTEDPSASTDPTDIVAMIINTVLGLMGIIFFVQMFYAGFRWMTSSGSEEIIKESKGTIRSSIIGIVIAFSAFLLTNFVISRIQNINQTTAAPTLPATPAK